MRLFDFEHDANYETFTWRTEDPRVVAVVTRDPYPEAPDGDAFAPAGFLDHRGAFRIEPASHTFEDDEALEAYAAALNHFRDRETAERYMRIFHGVRQVVDVYGYRHDPHVVILDTPAFRAHVGVPDTAEDILAGDRETWQAYLDGDVYAVGALVNPEHVGWGEGEETPRGEFDGDGWEWSDYGLVHGHYGDAWAVEAALEAAENAAHDLSELLPFEEVA